MFKKSFAVTMSLILILLSLPLSVMAEETLQVNSLDQLETVDVLDATGRQVVVIYNEKQEDNIGTLDLSNSEIIGGESVSSRVDVIEVAEDVDIDAFLAELRSQPNVLAADLNQLYEKSSLPDDPYIQNGQAWQFTGIGQDLVWDQVENEEAVVVAVLDTGLNTQHPDLLGRIVEGYDYLSGSTQVVDRDWEEGHGTAVSGFVVATANNGIGTAGVAGTANVKVAPFCIGDGSYSNATIAAALMDAADRADIDVINMSYGGYGANATELMAINYALSKGKILVASSGNEGDGREAGQYSYPASYDGVISVGATDSNQQIAYFSQYNDKVDLVAPGVGLVTTDQSGGYATEDVDGTSFSSPIVAGACALLLAADSSLTATEVESTLKETALDLGQTGKDNYYGYGLIQLDKALELVTQAKPTDPEDPADPVGLEAPDVFYHTHVQNYGWQNYVSNGETSGTSGEGLRLEGIEINLGGSDYDLGIAYSTHVENYGWQDYVYNGQMSGSQDEGLRLEAIRIDLVGEDAELFDVYYRVHAQNVGWMGWAKNGADSGTSGYGYRLEGIEIVVLPAGEMPTGSMENAFIEA
ncbi:S8 family serine peptidase [Eubacteriaceae bacterium ES3]|nr:S8 family serine peptidase [Eubacteriaceae bacterium ES3]